MSPKLMVGGQAVIEGVMMRGPKLTATAVRDPSGKIQVEVKPVHSISERFPILKKPFMCPLSNSSSVLTSISVILPSHLSFSTSFQ